MRTIWLKLLRLLQKQCSHPDYAVRADILEGGWDQGLRGVQWCECCGAFRFNRSHTPAVGMAQRLTGSWHTPRPNYYTPAERKEYLRAFMGI